MLDENGQWRWELFDRFLPCELLLRITAIKPPLGISYDPPGLMDGVNQAFSVRAAAMVRQGTLCGPIEPIWRAIAEFKDYRDLILLHSLRMAKMGILAPEQSRAVVASVSSSVVPTGWCKPSPGWHKLNTDGYVRQRSGNILADHMAKMASESDPESSLIVRRFFDPPFRCRDILEEQAVQGIT
ncbi:hypothetical protein V6N12_047369 [Hibiscus sabdariffa]|uniref:RNase H type-1 domain-containing protein n=1 Tax=Hibiscus sabdariffa TaxID=183260 RepID=A0ABR2DAN3_9ROSI